MPDEHSWRVVGRVAWWPRNQIGGRSTVLPRAGHEFVMNESFMRVSLFTSAPFPRKKGPCCELVALLLRGDGLEMITYVHTVDHQRLHHGSLR